MRWQQVTRRRPPSGTARQRGGPVPPSAAAQDLANVLMECMYSDRSGGRAGPSSSGGGKKSEWECKQCSTMNYLDRKKCRRCGAGGRASPSAGGGGGGSVPAKSPKEKEKLQSQGAGRSPPKVIVKAGMQEKPPPPPKSSAPWKRAQDAAADLKALTAALEAAQAAGAGAATVADLEERRDAARKAAVDSRPLAAQIEGCKAWIKRAEKRAADGEAKIRELTDAQDALNADVTAHREKLRELERKLAGDTPPAERPPAEDAEVAALRAAHLALRQHAEQLLGVVAQLQQSGGAEIAQRDQRIAELQRQAEAASAELARQREAAQRREAAKRGRDAAP
eukprot:gene13266-11550_t